MTMTAHAQRLHWTPWKKQYVGDPEAVSCDGKNYVWTFSSISLESVATFKFLNAKKLLRIKDEGTDAV